MSGGATLVGLDPVQGAGGGHSPALSLMLFDPSRFGLTWELALLSSFLFVLSVMGMSILGLSHHVFWKQRPYLVWQVPIWS